MSADGSTYFRVLGVTIGIIMIAGAGRLLAGSAADELRRQQTTISPMQLETLANYLRPLPPTQLPRLVEPVIRPRDVSDDFMALPGGDEPSLAPAAPTWVVTAILITDTRRVAVVNEDLVTIGSTVRGGARVTAIERDHVVLTEPGGRRRVLRVAANN